ncbi:MAG: protein kinase [Anaerolineaceae bacterium]|nr:protein kinase [Anaerolineaceae bacterium]
MPDLTGKSLGQFYILEPLGEGGMAFVYKAYDTREEQDVALKVILPGFKHSEEFKKVFHREARIVKNLIHPNIVKILGYGEHDGLHYLVLEYVPGGTLKRFMGTPMSWVDADVEPAIAGTNLWSVNVIELNLAEAGKEYVDFMFHANHFTVFVTPDAA